MSKEDELTININKLKEITKEQLMNAFNDGVKQGVKTTCLVLYRTFLMSGLEPTNVLFLILEDLAAKQGGCADIKAEIKQMEEMENGQN